MCTSDPARPFLSEIRHVVFKRETKKKYSDSAVIFEGSHAQWQAHFEKGQPERYEPDTVLEIKAISASGAFEFTNVNAHPDSEELICLIDEGLCLFVEKFKKYPTAFKIVEKEIFSNLSNIVIPLQVRCSQYLPTDATREVFLDDQLNVQSVNIVLHSDLVRDVISACRSVSQEKDFERLGILWALIHPLLHELGHKNLPRDRFFEEIHRVWCDSVIMRNLLFKQKRADELLAANKTGKIFIKFFTERTRAEKDPISERQIFRQPLFEMLNQLHLQVDEETLARYDKMKVLSFTDLADAAKVIIREYLDDQYLRPSLAQVMATIPEAYRPCRSPGIKTNRSYPNRKPDDTASRTKRTWRPGSRWQENFRISVSSLSASWESGSSVGCTRRSI